MLLTRVAFILVIALVFSHAHAKRQRDADEDDVAMEAKSSVTIPLQLSVDEDKRSQLLMTLKQRWEQVWSSNDVMVEEGSRTGKEVPLEVEILSTKHLATYYGVIGIEQTQFKVLFDTGSCEFWVPSAACKTDRCQRHSLLPEASRPLANQQGMNIQYLSGKVQGDMVYETVTLGDISVQNQVVGLAKVVDIELLDDVRWDGILGLAYPNPTLQAQGITPIFDTIKNSGILTQKHLSNQFAYYIDDRKGAVTFGGADCDLIAKGQEKKSCIDQFKFVPVTEKTYWTITIKDVKIKYPGQPERAGFCPSGGCKAIVDTGTYLIYGPETQVTSMVSSELKSCDHHGEMPTFVFDFYVNDGDEPVSVTLEPIDYILKFNLNGRKDCVVGISPDKDTIWTLGQVFLRSFYTVFDRDEDRIGFARLPRTNFKALNSKETMKALAKRHSDVPDSLLELKDADRLEVSKASTTLTRKMLSRVTKRDDKLLHTVIKDNAEQSESASMGDRDNTQHPLQPEHTQMVMDGLRHVRYDPIL